MCEDDIGSQNFASIHGHARGHEFVKAVGVAYCVLDQSESHNPEGDCDALAEYAVLGFLLPSPIIS